MKNLMKMGVTVALVAGLAGCASSRIVDQPSKITLEEALKSVGQGLHDMKEAQKDVKTGLIPAEVSVTFNIAASGSDDGKLYVELSSVPVQAGMAEGHGELGSKLSAERGNQITVKFVNLLLAGKDTVVFDKTPDEIQSLLDTLQKSGIQIYKTPEPRMLP
ncbi:MAG: hypothetical protein A2Z25_01245 [Planctomycetes bacterium RBG_16_55_9]|nr:MAG: hypothetical protein A2Z25_01245 [Planctomycetes bacterium RBG_16_55_9]